jgi:hypothetical protein
VKEYKIFFQPAFHDHLTLCLQIDGDYAIFSLESPPQYGRFEKISSAEEASSALIEGFNKEISAVNPLFIHSMKDGGIDGINIECSYSDEEYSNRFSVWSPRGNDYQEHLVFINSVYRLARRVFTDEACVRLLENLNYGRYFS